MFDALMIVLLLGLAVAIGFTIRNQKLGEQRIALLRSQDYSWYKSQFPELVEPGKVTCYNCKSSKIFVSKLMNRTFLRAHTCQQCATTLYYSSEH